MKAALAIAAVVLALVAGIFLGRHPLLSAPRLEAGYHAVLLANGQALFGRLDGLGTAYPVLTDVFYVQTYTDPQTRAQASTLVKRGQEWHGPNRTILNADQIVLVEPVTEGSQVAKLIAEAHRN